MFRALNHVNLIKFYYLDVPDFALNGSIEVKLVMNFVKGVSLSQLINKMNIMNQFLSRIKVQKISIAILNALNYLHSCNIVHRDLKPSNILIDEQFNVYLADYGISKLLDEYISITHSTVGTPMYMAPET